MTAYLKTPFADRGRYLTDPEEFEKVQETYYKGQSIPDEAHVTVTSVKRGPKADYLTVVARFKISSDGETNTAVWDYYVLVSKDGLKYDWAASTGFNAVPFTTWAVGTDDTLTLRVQAELDDYYNCQYSEAKKTHYSISFEANSGNRSASIHGYVTKGSDLGKKLFDIVKDGQKNKLTVTDERTGKEASFVGIKQLVSETWVK